MGASVLLLHAEIKDESRSGAGCEADAKEGLVHRLVFCNLDRKKNRLFGNLQDTGAGQAGVFSAA